MKARKSWAADGGMLGFDRWCRGTEERSTPLAEYMPYPPSGFVVSVFLLRLVVAEGVEEEPSFLFPPLPEDRARAVAPRTGLDLLLLLRVASGDETREGLKGRPDSPDS